MYNSLNIKESITALKVHWMMMRMQWSVYASCTCSNSLCTRSKSKRLRCVPNSTCTHCSNNIQFSNVNCVFAILYFSLTLALTFLRFEFRFTANIWKQWSAIFNVIFMWIMNKFQEPHKCADACACGLAPVNHNRYTDQSDCMHSNNTECNNFTIENNWKSFIKSIAIPFC